jgi:hypothetical protein
MDERAIQVIIIRNVSDIQLNFNIALNYEILILYSERAYA